jgi:hypothetical protein
MDDSIFSLLSHLLARETPQPHSSSSSSSLREQRLCFQHRIGSHFKSARRYQSSYLGLCWHLLPYICTRIIHTWTVTSESTGAHMGHRLLPFPSFLFLLALYGRTRRSNASKSSDRLPFLLIHHLSSRRRSCDQSLHHPHMEQRKERNPTRPDQMNPLFIWSDLI